jgi:hypothetical protein
LLTHWRHVTAAARRDRGAFFIPIRRNSASHFFKRNLLRGVIAPQLYQLRVRRVQSVSNIWPIHKLLDAANASLWGSILATSPLMLRLQLSQTRARASSISNDAKTLQIAVNELH